jgi:hypothetical protein
MMNERHCSWHFPVQGQTQSQIYIYEEEQTRSQYMPKTITRIISNGIQSQQHQAHVANEYFSKMLQKM